MPSLPPYDDLTDRPGQRRATAPLRVPTFRSYWLGQSVSATGAWMQQVSLPWLLLELGGGPLHLGVFAALYFGPAFVLAPVGGVLADRSSKRNVLIVANISLMAQAATLCLVAVTGHATIPLVLGLTVWQGITNAVEMPFRHAFVAELVPRAMLSSAIALSALAFNLARILGPAIAGLILGIGTAVSGSSQTAVAWTLALNAIGSTAILAALHGIRIKAAVPSGDARDEQPRLAASLREGLAFSIHTPLVIFPLGLLAGLATFGYNFQTLLPLFGKDVLRVSAAEYGGLFATLGIGGVAGAAVIAMLKHRRAIPILMTSGVVFAAGLGALAFVDTYFLSLAVLLIVGCAWMAIVSGINATIQANVPHELRGRVMSLYVTAFVGGAPVGGLLAAALAASFGASFAFAASSCLSAGVIIAFGLAVRGSAAKGSLGITDLDFLSGADAPTR